MRNALAHKIQWSGPTVHSFTVVPLSYISEINITGILERAPGFISLKIWFVLGSTSFFECSFPWVGCIKKVIKVNHIKVIPQFCIAHFFCALSKCSLWHKI